MASTIRYALAALALLAGAGASHATEVSRPVAVLELFTSQGCNSCPDADRLLGEMAATKEVVALAYHVDYWDYLGWRDTLATADNTARQHEYNRAFGSRSVYTPQAVINGREHVNGSDAEGVRRTIRELSRSAKGMSVDVALSYVGDSIVIETGAAERQTGEAHVFLVYLKPATTVEIKQGKNKGRRITYRHAVAGFHSAGVWRGEAARYELPIAEMAKKGAGGCAVLIQSMGPDGVPGPVLGAALIDRPDGY
jgi:hypothetical protein